MAGIGDLNRMANTIHCKYNYRNPEKEQRDIIFRTGFTTCIITIQFSDSLIGEEPPRFGFRRPDGEVILLSGNIVDIEKGIVDISLPTQLTSIVGEYEFEVRRTEGGKHLTSPTYKYTVMES